MTQHQTGVLAPVQANARYLVFSLPNQQKHASLLGEVCKHLPSITHSARAYLDDASLTATYAFGPDLWKILFHGTPNDFYQLQAYDNGRFPVGCGDLFVHVSGQNAGGVYELARQIYARIQPWVDVLEDEMCFCYLDGRDLTGFVDGVANPKGDVRAQAALVGEEQPAWLNCAYTLVTRFVHHLTDWEAVEITNQEEIVGCSKAVSVEIENKKPHSHIGRVEIEEDGKELKILRHSMPYAHIGGESGLFFLAYARNANIFRRMLSRMYGHADGVHDALMQYTTPVYSGLFVTPSIALLEAL